MKKIFYILFAFSISEQINAIEIVDEGIEKKAGQWLKNQPVRFLENKGQMTDMNGNSIPFVLFKAKAPGLNLYITENGLTYVFF